MTPDPEPLAQPPIRMGKDRITAALRQTIAEAEFAQQTGDRNQLA